LGGFPSDFARPVRKILGNSPALLTIGPTLGYFWWRVPGDKISLGVASAERKGCTRWARRAARAQTNPPTQARSRSFPARGRVLVGGGAGGGPPGGEKNTKWRTGPAGRRRCVGWSGGHHTRGRFGPRTGKETKGGYLSPSPPAGGTKKKKKKKNRKFRANGDGRQEGGERGYFCVRGQPARVGPVGRWIWGFPWEPRAANRESGDRPGGDAGNAETQSDRLFVLNPPVPFGPARNTWIGWVAAGGKGKNPN